jgi:Zn-dependent alcohol dehydrogenase
LIAAPKQREVLVQIAVTAVCHSDLSAARGRSRGTLPIILGHEASGIVTEVGDGVTKVKKGDRVILSWPPHCGHCFHCHETLTTMCNSYMKGAVAGGLWDGTSRVSTAKVGAARGAVRRMRTSFSLTLNAGTHAEQSWRHSARAAARSSLKLFLRQSART